jgi:hypothetical protein
MGLTWTSILATNGHARSIAVSADGGKVVVAAQGKESTSIYDGTIYFWQNTPRPSLFVTGSNDLLLLHWLVPSAPYLLQSRMSFAEGDWADVQIVPSLNYPTLQYQVTVPKEPPAEFYRLILTNP